MRRLCPVCVRRRQNVVDPECMVCQGDGFLELAEPALSTFAPEVVAEAVLLGLEVKARISDKGLTLSDDRLAGVRAALVMFQEAGIISNRRGLSPRLSEAVRSKRGAARPAVALAAEVVQEPLDGLDEVLANAEPYTYGEGERPGQRGLPLLSAEGHPSHLARVADPADPQGDTGQLARRRRSERRQANVLLEAGWKAAEAREPRHMAAEELELFSTAEAA